MARQTDRCLRTPPDCCQCHPRKAASSFSWRSLHWCVNHQSPWRSEGDTVGLFVCTLPSNSKVSRLLERQPRKLASLTSKVKPMEVVWQSQLLHVTIAWKFQRRKKEHRLLSQEDNPAIRVISIMFIQYFVLFYLMHIPYLPYFILSNMSFFFLLFIWRRVHGMASV